VSEYAPHPTHVIVGAGAIGSATARLLAGRGESVRVVTRSGSGPDLPGVERVAADATDAERLTELTTGAAALYNCANPQYHQWFRDWPPLAAALLATAERTGAVLATVSCLYGYGDNAPQGFPASAPMTEDTPLSATEPKLALRAQMWKDALALHEAGRIRATEVRGSDYVGAHSQSHLGDRVVPKVLAGRSVQVIGGLDNAHTWTYVGDVAELLTRVATDEQAWGKAWHVPSGDPVTQRAAVADIARVAGVPAVKVSLVPKVLLRGLGLVSPMVRELPTVAYQQERPFVMDSSLAQRTFGLAPTPWDEVLAETVASFRTAQPA
jgi:nucleoside-diphosphate-sugar epimerase